MQEISAFANIPRPLYRILYTSRDNPTIHSGGFKFRGCHIHELVCTQCFCQGYAQRNLLIFLVTAALQPSRVLIGKFFIPLASGCGPGMGFIIPDSNSLGSWLSGFGIKKCLQAQKLEYSEKETLNFNER